MPLCVEKTQIHQTFWQTYLPQSEYDVIRVQLMFKIQFNNERPETKDGKISFSIEVEKDGEEVVPLIARNEALLIKRSTSLILIMVLRMNLVPICSKVSVYSKNTISCLLLSMEDFLICPTLLSKWESLRLKSMII